MGLLVDKFYPVNNSKEISKEEGMFARVVTYNCKYCLHLRKRVTVYISHLLIHVGYHSRYSNLLWADGLGFEPLWR
jgi:prepilin-type processing-associated H-X9-DG protein